MLTSILLDLFILHLVSMGGVHLTAKALNYKIDDDYTWVPFVGLVGNIYLTCAMLGNAQTGAFKALTSKAKHSGQLKLLDKTSKEEFYGYNYTQLEEYTKKFLKVLTALNISYNEPYVNGDKRNEYYNYSNLFIMIKGSNCSSYTDRKWENMDGTLRIKDVPTALKMVLGLLASEDLPAKAVPVLLNMVDTLYTVYADTDEEIISEDLKQMVLKALHEYYNTFNKVVEAEKALKRKEIEEKMEFHTAIALPRIKDVENILVDIQSDYDEQLKKHGIDLKKV